MFGIDNEKISYAKKERIDKQYYADFEVTKSQVEELIDSAEDFIFEIDFYIAKLNIDKIKQLRKEFSNVYLN